MIPRLVDANVTDTHDVNELFLTDGVLSCVVTEERNGLYELQMVVDANNDVFLRIETGKNIVVKPNETDGLQLFRIYRITKPLNNRATVYAEHISYRLSQVPVRPFDASNASAQTALTTLKNNAMISCPFEFVTDITTISNFSVTEPSSLKSKLIGEQGSILQVYGGEYKYDNFTVNLLQSRGSDNGVSLLYGKNVTDLAQDEKISGTYSGICPFWTGFEEDGETEIIVTLPEEIVYTANHASFPYERVIPVDLTDKFENEPTVEQLRNAANSYIVDNNVGAPDVSITVSFVPIWQAQGYEELEKFEQVSLCDTVTVFFEKLGIATEAKVVKTVYDCLKERYESVSIGTIKQNFTGTMNSTINDLRKAIARKK